MGKNFIDQLRELVNDWDERASETIGEASTTLRSCSAELMTILQATVPDSGDDEIAAMAVAHNMFSMLPSHVSDRALRWLTARLADDHVTAAVPSQEAGNQP